VVFIRGARQLGPALAVDKHADRGFLHEHGGDRQRRPYASCDPRQHLAGVNTAERRGGIEMHSLFLGLVGRLLDRISAGRKPQPPELA
jgi:hypothetical protein